MDENNGQRHVTYMDYGLAVGKYNIFFCPINILLAFFFSGILSDQIIMQLLFEHPFITIAGTNRL